MSEMTAITTAACMAQVIASPTRIKLLKLIEEEELCVCELAELLAISQPAVSQHLSKLRQAGLVSERRVGQMALYRAADVKAILSAAIGPVLAASLAELPEMAAHRDRLTEVQARRLFAAGAPPARICPKEEL